MTKKINEEKKAALSPEDLKKYSHQIWLAGLGAYARIEREGQEMFDGLVNKGQVYEEQLREHKDKAESRIDALKSRANETWGRVERAFDDRLNATLNRLGISSQSDIEYLNEQVERLTDLIEALRKLEDED